MVVLGAAVLTKPGKVLISRHFVEMNRVRVEGLLAAFPKLIGSTSKQHTFVETESVRYVYQPLDTLYMLIMTNKSSNIIEDLETLRLLAKLIPEYCQSVDEEGIMQSQYELIFAFDEAIALGYRENVKPEQIRTYTEMDSHEEKLFNMLQEHKKEEAIRDGARRAAELEKQRAAARRAGTKPMSSIGSDGTSVSGGGLPPPSGDTTDFTPPPMPASKPAAKVGGGPRAAGMSLGSKTVASKANQLLSALESEGALVSEPAVGAGAAAVGGLSAATGAISSAAPAAAPRSDAVHVAVEEKVNVKLDAEGGLQSVEVLGNLAVLVQDKQYEHVSVVCQPLDRMFQVKLNPKINKEAFNTQGVLVLSDPSRGVPVGSSQVLLKWRMPPSVDESRVPLTVNCWPSEISGGFSVNLDYELMRSEMKLENVVVSIPLAHFGGSAPTVIQTDGATDFDAASSSLRWHIPQIDSSSLTGTLEFEVRGEGTNEVFFPIEIAFISASTYAGLSVQKVVHAQSGADFPHSVSISMASDKYTVGA